MEEAKFGGKMELLKLSRLKLQLRALISELKDLRERERLSTQQLHLTVQKQKQSEEEFGKKLKELESQLSSESEARQKLERKVSYLQNDNAQLEIKQKELNDTIQSLLQSREQFLNAYQESTSDMKCSIEARDRKLAFFSEKLKSHLLLFDSIEKEALSVKQVVDNVRHVINEKEDVVAGLKRKFNQLSDVEKLFEKISEMENRLKTYKDELQRKDKIIYELEAKLKSERIANRSRTEVESLQKAISKKEAVIQNLITEKQTLDSELKSVGAVLEKIQHAFRDMSEDKESFLSIVKSKDKFCTIPGETKLRVANTNVDTKKDSEFQPALMDFTVCTAYSQRNLCDAYSSKEMQQTNNQESHAIEPACSATQSVYSVPESTTTAQTKLFNGTKHVSLTTACHVDSECSTTQEDTSEHPV